MILSFDEATALGLESAGGQLMLGNKAIGNVTNDGVVLNSSGIAYVQELQDAKLREDRASKPASRRGRPPKAPAADDVPWEDPLLDDMILADQ